jgi:ribosomal protein L29
METLATLRFGEQSQQVTNHVRTNVALSAEELERLLGETRAELSAAKVLSFVECDRSATDGGCWPLNVLVASMPVGNNAVASAK